MIQLLSQVQATRMDVLNRARADLPYADQNKMMTLV